MAMFDYTAAAELFPPGLMQGRCPPEAGESGGSRADMDDLPAPPTPSGSQSRSFQPSCFRNTCLMVDERLYESAEYPLVRRATCRF
jgi:hypothetical protein